MEPRLLTSRLSKSVQIPGDFRDLIKTVLSDVYGSQLGGRKIEVDGRIFDKEIVVAAGLSTPGSLRQVNLEASIDFAPGQQQATDQIHRCVEALGAAFGDLLAEEAVDGSTGELPVFWQEFEIEKTKLFLRSSTRNFGLDQMANEFLGEELDQLEDVIAEESDRLPGAHDGQ